MFSVRPFHPTGADNLPSGTFESFLLHPCTSSYGGLCVRPLHETERQSNATREYFSVGFMWGGRKPGSENHSVSNGLVFLWFLTLSRWQCMFISVVFCFLFLRLFGLSKIIGKTWRVSKVIWRQLDYTTTPCCIPCDTNWFWKNGLKATSASNKFRMM